MKIISVVAVCLAGIALLSGCGSREDEASGREGMDVTVGDLDYKVQFARTLNPDAVTDKAYLVGQPKPPKGEIYLGVFIRVTNRSDETRTPTGSFSVVDTRDVRYRPFKFNGPFAYRAEPIPPDAELPQEDSAAETGVIGGAELLFRVKIASLTDRPLVLEFPGPGKERGEILLDI